MGIGSFKVIIGALVTVHLSALAACYAEDVPGPAAYGAKVKFKTGSALRFPDFELTYAGKRRVVPPQYPRGWWVYDFAVRNKSDTKTVSWSSGTGDIGPTRFQMNGRSFQIELSHSDKLGPLREDELVVSSVGDRS